METGELAGSLNRTLTDSDEVRWLLQSALLTLFVERAAPATSTPVDEPSGDRLPGRLSKHRGLAARVLEDEAHVLEDYYRLLNVALQEYLITVGLPNSKDEHHLRYTVPMASERSAGGRAKSKLRQLVAPGWRGYRVSYETRLPATVRSYHLVAETDPSLLVKKLVMTCDADSGTTKRLISDLSNLAPRLAATPGSPTDTGTHKILELELETAIRTLSEFVRRRTWEAQQAGGVLHPKRTEAVQILAAAGVSDHTYPSGDGVHRASLLANPQMTPKRLEEACTELRDSGFEWDLTHQDDPVTHRAIAYWRHHEAIDPGADLYTFKSSVLITDAANGTSNVAGFILAVLVVTYVVGASVFLQPWALNWKGTANPVAEPGLIIAVLLLVPGYLYSRLGSYRRTSVAARVRFRPRSTAYICIGSVALIAAFITGSPSTESFRVVLWCALGVQAVMATLLLLGKHVHVWGLHAWQREVLDASPKWFYISRRLPARPYLKQTGYDSLFNSER
jgi:hypothetical protein